MLGVVGSILKMVKFVMQHLWMLHDVVVVWPGRRATMLRPTMLRYVALKMLRSFSRGSSLNLPFISLN